MAALFTFTTFLAALLLFSVQPLVTRLLLPTLGGSPAVWNTAMVFFQAVLLAGYGYAHYLSKGFARRSKLALAGHALLLCLPLVFLPLALPRDPTPPATTHPVLWLLGLLAWCVGVPFFVISTTSPLLQRTFALTSHPAARDPYFLYAASNAGSLLALLFYPIVIEPSWPVSMQTKVWAAGYLLFVPCLWACLLVGSKFPATAPDPGSDTAAPPLPWIRRGRWILLALAPSSWMLSVTTYLSTDVVGIPLMWILPLSLYLISFMVVFGRRRRTAPEVWMRGLTVLVPLLAVVLAGKISAPLLQLMLLHLLTFFVAAVVCHGELARDRPPATQLTEFYGWMAFGGVLGGIFNQLLAPLLFHGVAEYGLTVVLTCLLLPKNLFRGGRESEVAKARRPNLLDFILPAGVGLLSLALIATVQSAAVRSFFRSDALPSPWLVALFMFGIPALWCLTSMNRPMRFGLGIGAMLLAGITNYGLQDAEVIDANRSFFGVNRVVYQPRLKKMVLFHGSTGHGAQFLGQRTPISYFSERGPAGDVIRSARFEQKRFHPERPFSVAVVGLGCGVLAGYIRPGEHWTFYEIDPKVAEFARDPRYFTYWSGAPTPPQLELGDARLRMQSAPAHSYDLILLDAYSSDTVPVHLVTREALALYRSKLARGGLIGWNLTNKYLDIEPVVGHLAADCGWSGRLRNDGHLPPALRARGISNSRWVCLGARLTDMEGISTNPAWKTLRRNAALWTDDYSSLWTMLWQPESLERETQARSLH